MMFNLTESCEVLVPVDRDGPLADGLIFQDPLDECREVFQGSVGFLELDDRTSRLIQELQCHWFHLVGSGLT